MDLRVYYLYANLFTNLKNIVTLFEKKITSVSPSLNSTNSPPICHSYMVYYHNNMLYTNYTCTPFLWPFRVFCRQCSTVRYIRKELRGHGQGFEEHVPDHRRRRVSGGPDHIPRFLARRKRTAIRLRSVSVHGVVRRDIPVQR